MRKLLLIVLLFTFSKKLIPAGADFFVPKYEMRGVWITTYANLDWPSEKSLEPEEQRTEFSHLMDLCQATNLNSVFVQVRPAADAFYPSKFAPWSEFLSGKQGKAPIPYYDPLQFMIESAHDRLLEFHAWMNPFRAICHNKYSDICPEHVSKIKPEWIFEYGTASYLNPGIPEVREYMKDCVLEIIENYDVDGIHFDDYYYPYTIWRKEIPDSASYNLYGSGFDNVEDWRRDNINQTVELISKAIKEKKRLVKFGVSPFGVWRNIDKDKDGSRTSVGQTSFDNLYCDVKKWMEEDWVDYVSPQMYWDFNHKTANYVELLDWWSQRDFSGHIYVGHAMYKIGNIWKEKTELTDQIRYARVQKNTSGDLFYRASTLKENPLEIRATLKNGLFKYLALPPKMSWLDSIAPVQPGKGEIENLGVTNKVKWEKTSVDQEYFAVYYNNEWEEPGIKNLLAITREPFFIDSNQYGFEPCYFISAFDRLHNESELLELR